MAICIVLLAAAAAAAPAARGQPEATTVAEDRTNRLSAAQTGDGRLCLRLEHASGVGGICEERLDVHEPVVVSSRGIVAGAVVHEVTSVEVEWRDGVRTVVNPTTHPDFGSLRFFIAPRASSQPFLVRYRSGDGILLATTQEGDGPRVAPRSILASGGGRRGRWSVTAWLERVLAPAPGMLDRTELVTCVERRTASSATTRCLRKEHVLTEPLDGDVFATTSDGRRHRLVLAALLSPATAAVEVHLGDGQRVRARVHRIGPSDARARMATYSVPAQAAVRQVLARDRSGKELDREVVMLPPATVERNAGATLLSPRPPLPGLPQIAAGPVLDGRGVLRLREVGARLCAEVEGTAPAAMPCGLIPLRAEESLLAGGTSEQQGVVGGVVPPQVATVELQTRRGPAPAVVRVTPGDPGPYAGEFAPHVRTFVTLLPSTGPVEARLLDANGDELAAAQLAAIGHVESVPPRRPRLRLRAGQVSLTSRSGDDRCVFLEDVGAGLLHRMCAVAGRRTLLAHVACRPAATVVMLPVGRRRDILLLTARGKRLPPRRLRLRGRQHAVFVIAAPDVPVAVNWRGGRIGFGRLESPRRQCGFRVGSTKKTSEY